MGTANNDQEKSMSRDLKRERIERYLPYANKAVLTHFPTQQSTVRVWADQVVMYAAKLADAMDKYIADQEKTDGQ